MNRDFSLFTSLAAHDVHVWQWDLDACSGEVDRYWQMLSADERERAGRFCQARHRRRYVVARGELRRILGRYFAVAPHAVQIGYGSDGKPFCTSQPGAATLCFNLSHTANVAALAVASGFEIGIDVEAIRPIEDDLPLDVLSPHERAAFAALPAAERQHVFFETWTRKEAALKALGTGFTVPPTHFEFDLFERGDTIPRAVGGDANEAMRWRIRSLATAPDCKGAVAARRTDWRIVEMNGADAPALPESEPVVSRKV